MPSPSMPEATGGCTSVERHRAPCASRKGFLTLLRRVCWVVDFEGKVASSMLVASAARVFPQLAVVLLLQPLLLIVRG